MNELPVVVSDKPETVLHSPVSFAIHQPVFNRFRELALLVSDLPLAVISLCTKNGGLLHCDAQLPLTPVDTFHVLCKQCLVKGEAVEIADLLQHSDFANKELYAGDQAIRFYAGFPLVNTAGAVIGVLSLLDTTLISLPQNKQRALQLLASQLAHTIMETDQKEEIKHLDRLLNVSKDLICTVGHDGYFIKLNSAFVSVLGWDEAYLLRTSLFDLVHRDDNVGTLKALARFTSGNSITKFTHRIRTRTGDYKFLQWVASPEPATGIFFAIARDITEQHLLEKDLNRTKEMLEQTNMMARIGGWEFDLVKQKMYWSPITRLIHEAESDLVPDIETGPAFYKAGESRDKINKAVAAVQEGKLWDLELDVSKCDLYELTSQATDIISYQAQNKKLEILLNISPHIPRFIWTDDVRLKQVLINLLSNAINRVLIIDDNDNNRMILKQMLLLKEVESDEAKNGFEALNLLARGTRYDAIIVDYHMPYMDGLETIRKIRKNFPDPSQKIMLLHSSSDDELIIQASEELNITSSLAKPIKMQEMYEHLFYSFRQNDTLTLQPADTAEATLPSQPITVLITEDNTANMMLARTIIRRIAPHARIVEASNGREAVKRFQAEKPDIIFMDIQMPEMNGWEASAKIRSLEEDTHTPIIALTASNIKGEREKCLAAGIDDFLSKPFAEEDLAKQFTRWTRVQVSTSRRAEPPPAEEKAAVYFDLQQVINYLDGDTDFLIEFLDITQKELESSMQELLAAASAHNLPALNTAAHKLKGTALITGMDKLSNLAKVLEKLAEFHESVVNDLLGDVQEEISLVIKHIEGSKD